MELDPIGLAVGDELRAAFLELAHDGLELGHAVLARIEGVLGLQALFVRGRQLRGGHHRRLACLGEVGRHRGQLTGRGSRRLAGFAELSVGSSQLCRRRCRGITYLRQLAFPRLQTRSRLVRGFARLRYFGL